MPAKKTYFGFAAFITGIISILFLGARFGVAYLTISPKLFVQLNQITTLVFCVFTPLSFALAVWGLTRKKDSKTYASIAIVLTTLPFAVLLLQFALSFVR